MKVLFVVPYAPTRIRTRPFHLIRALRSVGHDVTVATLWTSREERAALDELANDVAGVVAERLPVGRSLWNCVRAVGGGDPMQAHFSWSPRLAARLARVGEEPFDAIHVEHLRGVRYGLLLARLLQARRDRPALVWDSVDCISSLFRHASRESPVRRVRLAARLELRRTERYEGSVPARFDRVLVTSDIDRRDLLSLAPLRTAATLGSRIEVVPNGVDLEYFSPPVEPRKPLTLVITGKMSYHANATAVSRFVEQVMPTVWSQLPDVRVWVVGKDPTPELQRLGEPWKAPFADDGGDGAMRSRVRITGTVEDLRPFLRGATLAVAPIQYGAGIQNKVLEAMACATPVAATREAVAGLKARADEEVVVASTPEALAGTVVALLRNADRRARLGRAGRAFVEREHSWLGVGARVADIYRHARA